MTIISMHNVKHWSSFLSLPKDRKYVYKLLTAKLLQERLCRTSDYAVLQISERKTRNFAMLHFLLLCIHYEACHYELRQQIQWLALTDPFSVNKHLDLWQKRETDKVAMDKRPMFRKFQQAASVTNLFQIDHLHT